jgi:anti-sigma B factor antagonist
MCTGKCFQVAVARHDGGVTVRASGEIDVFSAPQFSRHLMSLAQESPEQIEVDLTHLDFIDCAGVGALAHVSIRLRQTGGQLAIKSTRRATRRVLEMAGLGDVVAP